MGYLKMTLAALTILLVNCSKTTVPNAPTKASEKSASTIEVLGVAQTTDGRVIDFDQLAQKNIVIVFASDTCTTCAEESKYWTKLFSSGLVENVYFAHFLIGGNLTDATDWKNIYKINWDVLIDNKDYLYRKYCPAIRTPCFLIINKNTNQIIQTYEILKKENIEEITGPWEF